MEQPWKSQHMFWKLNLNLVVILQYLYLQKLHPTLLLQFC